MASFRRTHENSSVSQDNFDFAVVKFKKKIKYFTDFGTECLHMNDIPEEYLRLSCSDNEYSLSSSEEEVEVATSALIKAPIPKAPVPKAPSPPRIVKKEKSSSPCSKKAIKEEIILSDDDSSYGKKTNTSSKNGTRHSKKPIKVEVISSDDDDSSYRKKEPASSKNDSRRKRRGSASSDDDSRERERHRRRERERKNKSSSSGNKKGIVSYPESESDGEHETKHKIRRDDEYETKHKTRRDDEYEARNNTRRDDEYEEKYNIRRDIKKEEYESKPLAGISSAFENYICKVCNIVMNSEVTMQTHMQGKKHLKALNAQRIPEVAMSSLRIVNETKMEIQRNAEKPEKIAERSRYPSPPPNVKRVRLNEKSHIQNVADEYRKGPMPGLDRVVEIRHIDKIEPTYYCKLCDAPCAPSSILVHLSGYKHQLFSLEMIDPPLYERYKYYQKRDIEKTILTILTDYERKYGRGTIQVEKEVRDDSLASREPLPGPSSRADDGDMGGSYGDSITDGAVDIMVAAMEDLDTSQNDFFCKVCDAHMNNQAMWETHVRGRRHAKNKKKQPGESQSKVKAVHMPHQTAHLEYQLRDEDTGEPIVGLDFIRETQNEMGDMYNCFLCGACTSSFDIVEHLCTTKHKVKFLETQLKKGVHNGIEDIKALHDVSTFAKDGLINQECVSVLEQIGPGKVQVYVSKKNLGR